MKNKLLVALIAITIFGGCKKDILEQEVDGIEFSKILKMEARESKSWFVKQTPIVQSEIWKYKLKQVLSYNWNENQQALLAKLRNEINRDWFEGNNFDKVMAIEKSWMLKAENEFSNSELFQIVGTLRVYSINRVKVLNKTTAPGGGDPQFECECSIDSDYCGWPVGEATCQLIECFGGSKRGCGFILRYPCEGSCSTASPL